MAAGLSLPDAAPNTLSRTRRPIWRVVLLIAVLASLQGCAWRGGDGPTFGPQDRAAAAALRQQILVEALSQIGRPYRYGGGDGNGFDCSGLVLHVYADANIALPRTAAEQQRVGRRIKPEAAQPGDLHFYSLGRTNHVVIDIGGGRGLHAPAPGRTVEIAHISRDWWQRRRVTSRRILAD
jgi:cell wall-associated NlpC family hydrolase